MTARLSCLVALSLALAPASPSRADDPPKGEVTKYTFDASKVFPGTTRDYWVYVPRQYDPAKPACLYVNQDGVQFKAPEVFDALIASGEMPVTIGVFVMHGRVKAPDAGAMDRFNRSYEYDGLGPNYARFLIDELLPDVETRTAKDGRPIRFSKDGNACAIGGSSSGAIAAFTAAWERPDRFRRVFSSIGTYVGLRGGNEYPTLIRKAEPKPLRIFLEDGSNDLNIYGGDWWMANQEMERAFQFAGYEVAHSWGDGGHNGKHATEVFPEAMKFLWKGWPEPVKAGAGSQQLRSLVKPGEGWTLVGEGYKFTEGPASNAKGEVFYCDIPNKKTYKVALDGTVSEFVSDNGGVSGQGFGPDGRLYATGPQGIVAFDDSGKMTPIAEGFSGNDMAIRHDGTIYATNPGQPSQVWRIGKDGSKSVVDRGGFRFSNGVTFSPDQAFLYVADSGSHWVYSYLIQPDGSLAHKQKYDRIHSPDSADDSGADGIKTDREGRLYVATRMGVQICDQPGRVNVILPVPSGQASNLCFGGAGFDTLFVTCGDKVYKRPLKSKGANAFEAPIKPPTPGL